MLDPEKVRTPLTDEWWVVRLASQLGREYPRLLMLEQWATNDAPVVGISKGDQFYSQKVEARKQARLNLAPQIVSNVLDRLSVETARTGGNNDDNGDTEVNRILKRNKMHRKIREILKDMLTFGRGYALVEQKLSRTDEPLAVIYRESPWQVITEQDPEDEDRVLAGIKIYRVDALNEDRIVLYRYDDNGNAVERVLAVESSSTKLPAHDVKDWKLTGKWDWKGEATPCVTEEIPLCLFENVDGKGVFEDHISTLARINEGIYKREFISASQAWRQKWVVKPPLPEEEESEERTFAYDEINGPDETEEDLSIEEQEAIFKLSMEQENEIWASIVDTNPGTISLLPHGASIEEGGWTDFRQLLEATKDDIRFLGEETATQFSMAISEAVNMSASGANAIRERGDKKAQTVQKYVGPVLEMMLSLAFSAQEDEARAEVSDIEIVWGDVREVTILDKATAFKQMIDAGLSKRMSMRIGLQLSPSQIMEEEQIILNEEFVKGLSTAATQLPLQQENVNVTTADQTAGGQTSSATTVTN